MCIRDRGHVAPGLYSTLAEKGYFPKEDLKTLRHTGSYLQGHPDMKHIPGIDMSSGSLGQGVSAAVGMAAAGKYDKKDYRVYTPVSYTHLDLQYHEFTSVSTPEIPNLNLI